MHWITLYVNTSLIQQFDPSSLDAIHQYRKFAADTGHFFIHTYDRFIGGIIIMSVYLVFHYFYLRIMLPGRKVYGTPKIGAYQVDLVDYEELMDPNIIETRFFDLEQTALDYTRILNESLAQDELTCKFTKAEFRGPLK
jgi:hypothetical protein